MVLTLTYALRVSLSLFFMHAFPTLSKPSLWSKLLVMVDRIFSNYWEVHWKAHKCCLVEVKTGVDTYKCKTLETRSLQHTHLLTHISLSLSLLSTDKPKTPLSLHPLSLLSPFFPSGFYLFIHFNVTTYFITMTSLLPFLSPSHIFSFHHHNFFPCSSHTYITGNVVATTPFVVPHHQPHTFLSFPRQPWKQCHDHCIISCHLPLFLTTIIHLPRASRLEAMDVHHMESQIS